MDIRNPLVSREELFKLSGNPAAKTVELHRPYIDEITCTCPECGKTMKRVPEVIDCWFDSGAMPFAQHHYPFENKDLFEAAVPGTVYFRSSRPDPWMVLFPDGRIHAAVQ